MARTVRRKNYEDTQGNSWDRKGRKYGGFYTEYDYGWPNNYRPMNKEEWVWQMLYTHGESSNNNARSPSRWYRQNRQRQNRSINRQELMKWIKADGEYEVMCEENPRSCWWDWS